MKLTPKEIKFINAYLKKSPGQQGKEFAKELGMGYSTYLKYKATLLDEIQSRQTEILEDTMQFLKDKAPEAAATIVDIMRTTMYDTEKRKAALDVLKMAGLYIDKRAIDLVVEKPESIVLWDFDEATDNPTD
tara:strand:+ start:68 stop:463 length:396 start_codon:yes stop_codon:yes gene_type:complete